MCACFIPPGLRYRRFIAIAIAICFWSTRQAAQGVDGNGAPTADYLLAAAHDAEIRGDIAGRFSLLREAARLSPDNELAHWQLGQIRVDDEWLAVEEVLRRAAADPRQDRYRDLRAQYGDMPQGQLALARWCRDNDLHEEARVHWASILSIDPNNADALKSLKMHWRDGQLVTRDQAKLAQQSSIQSRRTERQWLKRIAEWRRSLTKQTASAANVLDEIRAVDDVAAIPAFESVTLAERKQLDDRDGTLIAFSIAFIDSLEGMQEPAATLSLARHGVRSSFAGVRERAIARLQERPLHEYVPFLLDGLVAPIESSVQVVTDGDGSVQYLHSMYREGPLADMSHRVSRAIHQPASTAQIAAQLASTDLQRTAQVADAQRTRAISAATAARSARRYEEQIAEAERQIVQINEQNAASNERIMQVLRGATGQNPGAEPRAWWDWWQDDTEYYRTPERPVLATQDITAEYVTIPVQAKECFARGTLVWTKTGQRSIESLALGELVLAQEADTGELAFKPVIGRTVRPPSEILTLSVGGERIRASRGHLFWVPGDNWRMAKELHVGTKLHGLNGAMPLTAVESTSQEEAYNLVVADFNSYFVGETGLLVHDNTSPKATRAALPGVRVD